ncbi:Hypothetical protein HEAR0821 [Herminiimonas arsenicoxydans]|uniref:Uncharacterized protein n=1 Tax=Herminiimonas arsenicoxydans TaxID=204773 RepID=A4G3C3_HERAR|nr:Hypothetical protein HEAR0821 [Herminiimonas arsenicoxydans]
MFHPSLCVLRIKIFYRSSEDVVLHAKTVRCMSLHQCMRRVVNSPIMHAPRRIKFMHGTLK